MEIAKVSSAPLGQFSPSLQVMSLPFIWRDLAHSDVPIRFSKSSGVAAENPWPRSRQAAYAVQRRSLPEYLSSFEVCLSSVTAAMMAILSLPGV